MIITSPSNYWQGRDWLQIGDLQVQLDQFSTAMHSKEISIGKIINFESMRSLI